MSTVINYLIEVNLALLFFYGVYAVLLQTENEFSVNRFFLLGAMTLSLLLPLLHFNLAREQNIIPSVGQAIPTFWLPEVSVGHTLPSVTAVQTIWTTIQWIYLGIAASVTLIFAYRLSIIGKLIWSARKYAWRSCSVVESGQQLQTFSFFRFIFIGQADTLTLAEKARILEHEWVHVRQRHSIDLMVINVVGIVCWFNPIVIFYKKALVQLHEFEADARSVEESEVDTYCQLMAKTALASAGFSIVNHFHNSLTLKRITMMKTMKRKIQPWKIAAITAALPLVFFVISCQDQVASNVNTVTKNSANATLVPTEVSTVLAKLKIENPNDKFTVIEMNAQGKEALDRLQSDPAASRNIVGWRGVITEKDSDGQGRAFVIVRQTNELLKLAKNAVGADSVYTVAENQPEFNGGYPALRTYIQNSMTFPEDQKKAGIEGKVFVQFIVEKDGSVTNPEVIKGVAPALDKAALEVVSRMPAWKPGTQDGVPVRMKFVVPINYSLN